MSKLTLKILHKQLAKNAILSHITFVWPTFITVYACLREEDIPDQSVTQSSMLLFYASVVV